MSGLNEPVKFQFTFESMRADAEGECLLTLRLPAVDMPKAARFAMLREFLFSAVCTPEEVASKDSTQRL